MNALVRASLSLLSDHSTVFGALGLFAAFSQKNFIYDNLSYLVVVFI